MANPVTQLGLNIRPLLSYRADAFVKHAGVSDIFEHSKRILLAETFGLLFLMGPCRSGKTHFAVRLMDELSAAGKLATFVEGTNFESWLSQERLVDPASVTIVDDSHLYLTSLGPGMSGPMVNAIERARVAGAKFVLFSAAEICSFSFDDHVGSRLRAALQFKLGAPSEDEVELILAAIARQRGLHLSGRKLSAPSRRIARDLYSIEEYVERVLHLSKVVGKKVDLGVLNDAI